MLCMLVGKKNIQAFFSGVVWVYACVRVRVRAERVLRDASAAPGCGLRMSYITLKEVSVDFLFVVQIQVFR